MAPTRRISSDVRCVGHFGERSARRQRGWASTGVAALGCGLSSGAIPVHPHARGVQRVYEIRLVGLGSKCVHFPVAVSQTDLCAPSLPSLLPCLQAMRSAGMPPAQPTWRWEQWCGACRRQVPAAARLHSRSQQRCRRPNPAPASRHGSRRNRSCCRRCASLSQQSCARMRRQWQLSLRR